MEIRLVCSEDWPAIEKVFIAEGGTAPDPAHATAAVAIENGELVGFWVLQESWHCGPLWIREDHRRTGLWGRLNAAIDRIFTKKAGTGYYSFSGEPKVEEIFKRLGYIELPYKLWKKEF